MKDYSILPSSEEAATMPPEEAQKYIDYANKNTPAYPSATPEDMAAHIAAPLDENDLKNFTEEDKQDILNGKVAVPLISPYMHSDVKLIDRFLIKNFGPDAGKENTATAIDYFKKEYPQFDQIIQNEQILMRKKDEKTWHPIDGNLFTEGNLAKLKPQDIGKMLGETGMEISDHVYDFLTGVAQTVGATAGAAGTLTGATQVGGALAGGSIGVYLATKGVGGIFGESMGIPKQLATLGGGYAGGALGAGVGAALASNPIIGGMGGAMLATGIMDGLKEGISRFFNVSDGSYNFKEAVKSMGMAGALTALFGPGVAKHVAEKFSLKKAEKELATLIPDYKDIAKHDIYNKISVPKEILKGTESEQIAQATRLQKQSEQLLDLVPYADTPEEAAQIYLREKAGANLENFLSAQQGVLKKSYDIVADKVIPGTLGFLSGTPMDALARFTRRASQMERLNGIADSEAAEIASFVKQKAEQELEYNGKGLKKIIANYKGPSVILKNVEKYFSDKINAYDELAKKQWVTDFDIESAKNLRNFIEKNFAAKSVNPNISAKLGRNYAFELPLHPKEIQDMKQQFRELGLLGEDVALKDIADLQKRAEVKYARDIYGLLNDAVDEAVPKAKLYRQRYEKYSRITEDLNKIFPGKGEGIKFNQTAYTKLMSPDTSSRVSLMRHMEDVDSKYGIKGDQSLFNRITDLWAHSFFGDVNKFGYNKKGGISGASTLASGVAGLARQAETEKMYGLAYMAGKALGAVGFTPNRVATGLKGGYTVEDVISKVLSIPRAGVQSAREKAGKNTVLDIIGKNEDPITNATIHMINNFVRQQDMTKAKYAPMIIPPNPAQTEYDKMYGPSSSANLEQTQDLTY